MTLAFDRYLTAIDRAVADNSLLGDVLDVFSPDAVVQLDGTPILGSQAIREVYQQFITAHVTMKHYWNTTVLPDGRQRGEWACAARTADGSVITVAGVEHVTVDPDGRIVELHNEFSRRPAPA